VDVAIAPTETANALNNTSPLIPIRVGTSRRRGERDVITL